MRFLAALLRQDAHDLAVHLAIFYSAKYIDGSVQLLAQFIPQDPKAVLWRPDYVIFATPIYM
ncbi:hypothetical protein OkiPb00507_48500 [Escherichia coli]